MPQTPGIGFPQPCEPAMPKPAQPEAARPRLESSTLLGWATAAAPRSLEPETLVFDDE
jgi:hypothetical protein